MALKKLLQRTLAAMLTVCALASCQYIPAPPAESDESTELRTSADGTEGESGTLLPEETSDPGERGSLGEPEFDLKDPEVEVPILSKYTMLADSEREYNGGKAGCATLTVPAKYNSGLDFDITAKKDSATKTFHLFLPCRVDASELIMTVTDRSGEVRGPYLADFTDDEATENKKVIGHVSEYRIEVHQSDLPSMMIQIDESYGTVLAMNKDSKHKTYCYGDVVTTVTDEMALEKGWDIRYLSKDEDEDQPCSMDMRGRGNATWNYSKKAYQINLENTVGLLGMDRATKYVLLANFNDASFLRNQLAETLSREMGIQYVMESRQVDLFLNGTYLGIYQVAEKVEVGQGRVDIDRNDDILFEVDNYYQACGDAGFYSNTSKKGYRIHSPEDPDTYDRSKELLLAAEQVLYSGKQSEAMKLFDFESWARMYLIQEFTMNGDAFSGSLYFYYNHEDGKFYACAPWDFDWTLGLMWEGGDRNPLSFTSQNRWWMNAFFTYPAFVEILLDEYYQYGGRDILVSSSALVKQWKEEIKLSAEMNSLGSTIRDLPYDGTTFDEAVDYLLNTIEIRLGWMDTQMKGFALSIAYPVPQT